MQVVTITAFSSPGSFSSSSDIKGGPGEFKLLKVVLLS